MIKIKINAGEKTESVMAYTDTYLVWGEVVVKEQVRVSTWLRTNVAPDIMHILNARILIATAPMDQLKPLTYSEIHIPTERISAFHLIPPAKDPLDYDASEPNRQMNPIAVIIGGFQLNGFMRMSTHTNLTKYLEITRENYTSIYDCEIKSTFLPALGTFHVPFLLVRQNAVVFSTRVQKTGNSTEKVDLT